MLKLFSHIGKSLHFKTNIIAELGCFEILCSIRLFYTRKYKKLTIRLLKNLDKLNNRDLL